jgi:hypothetical protein
MSSSKACALPAWCCHTLAQPVNAFVGRQWIAFRAVQDAGCRLVTQIQLVFLLSWVYEARQRSMRQSTDGSSAPAGMHAKCSR